MKLKDILTKDNYKTYGDMDVYNDCIDDSAPCWCGTTLTDYGKSVYPALELEAYIKPDNWVEGGYCIMVEINDLPEGEDDRMWDETVALFSDMAGYIPEDDYNKRFETDEEEEPEPKAVFSIKIIDDESRIKEDGWDFPLSEMAYLLAEHEGETFVLKGGRLYEAEEV